MSDRKKIKPTSVFRTELAKTKVETRSRELVNKLQTDSLAMMREAAERGMNFSRYLEFLDPSKAYDKPNGDAFDRALKACGIRTESIPALGIWASRLEDLVRHPKAKHLAIEYLARAYRAVAFGAPQQRATVTSFEGTVGSMINQFAYPSQPRGVLLEPAIPLSEIVSQTVGITQSYYKPFYLEDISQATMRVGEGAAVPAVRISTGDKTITLKKYGRRIDMTYEAVRRIPIDLLAFYVQRIAVKIETEKVDKVVDIIVNGDGNSGTAATSYDLTDLDSGTTANNLTLKAWLAFRMKFKNPYMLTHALGRDDTILGLMLQNTGSTNIALMQAGSPLFAAQTVVPINQTLRDGVRAGWLDSPPSGKIIGIDGRLSVERAFEIGANLQESEKDIIQQINTLVLTEVEGYNVLEQEANKILDLTA